MPSLNQRIPAIPQSEWTDEVREIFTIMQGPEARKTGTEFNACHTLARHPRMATAVLSFHVQFLSLLSLPPKVTETIVMRMAWRFQTEYERAHHRRMARDIGFTEEHCEAVKKGTESPIWADDERLAIQAADQLFETRQIDDNLWRALGKHFTQKQLIELVYLIGEYSMNCTAFNAIRMELEPQYQEYGFRSIPRQ